VAKLGLTRLGIFLQATHFGTPAYPSTI